MDTEPSKSSELEAAQSTAQHSFSRPSATAIRPIVKYQSSATENLLCAHVNCYRERENKQEFCLQHIQLSNESQYRQCSYVSVKNGLRCVNLRPKESCVKEGFCIRHARFVTKLRRNDSEKLLKSFPIFKERPPKLTLNSLINMLNTYGFDDEPIYADDDDVCSFSVSDLEIIADNGDTDTPGLPSTAPYEPLRYAGVYSAEEATLITRDKLLRLQALYLQEMQSLKAKLCFHYKHKPKRKRKSALISGASVKLPSNVTSVKPIAWGETNNFALLGALKRYKKQSVLLAVRRSKEKAMRNNEKCNKCLVQLALPCSKFCAEHIVGSLPRQYLFKKCAFQNCNVNLVFAIVGEFCPLHAVNAGQTFLESLTIVSDASSMETDNPLNKDVEVNCAQTDDIRKSEQKMEDISHPTDDRRALVNTTFDGEMQPQTNETEGREQWLNDHQQQPLDMQQPSITELQQDFNEQMQSLLAEQVEQSEEDVIVTLMSEMLTVLSV